MQTGIEQRPRGREVAAEGVDRAEDSVGDHANRVRGRLVVVEPGAELGRLVPITELAQDVGHAGDAALLRTGVVQGAAEAERAVERLTRTRVVGRRLQHGAEPLVEVGSFRGQVVLERDRESGADCRHPRVEVAALRPGRALEAECACPQVGAPGTLGFARRLRGELDRLAVAAGALQVDGGGDPVDRGLRRHTRALEPIGRAAAGDERAAAIAEQSVDVAEPLLDLGAGLPGPLAAPDRRHLSPGARGLVQLARELRALAVCLDRVAPARRVLVLGPELERLPARGGGVAVCVGGAELGDRPQKGGSRSRLVARSAPVGGDLHRRAVVALEHFGEAAVQGLAAQPGDVLVDRIASERMAEARPARVGLGDQPAIGELGQAVAARELRDGIDPEPLTGDRRGLGGGARGVRDPGDPHQHGVADRLRDRYLGGVGELEAIVALADRAAREEGTGELLDEERIALGAVLNDRGEFCAGLPAEDLGDELARMLGAEGSQRQLLEPARAPELVAEPPQRVVAADLVGAVGGEYQHRVFGEPGRHAGEQVQRRCVRPLQVVEDDQLGARIRGSRDRAAHGLEQRLAVRLGRGLAHFGEEEGDVRAQRPAIGETVGAHAEE